MHVGRYIHMLYTHTASPVCTEDRWRAFYSHILTTC